MPPRHALFCPTPSQDPYAALATAVADLLLNAPLRATLGRRGHRHVVSTHDVRHTAAAVADVCRDVLGIRPGCGEAGVR